MYRVNRRPFAVSRRIPQIACAIAIVACTGTVISLHALAAADASYHLLKKVVLGGEGDWDYLTCDSAARRVYISRGTHVMVIDADTYTIVGDIPGTDGAHGIALAPDLGRGFVSDGRANTVTVFELKTLKVLGTAPTGNGPDAILYDPVSKRVFTFDGPGGNATAIDAVTGRRTGTLALGGDPEFAVADGRGYIYNNLNDKNELVQIDSRKLTVINRWPLAPCEGPSGLAIDREHQRLFAGCHNEIMAVLDANSGKMVATPAIGRGVDANAFDPGTQFALSSNGDGTLTIIREDSPEKFTPLTNVATQRGARTMALDPKTHRIFLVMASFGRPPAPSPRNPHPRPPVLPGTFTLLVFGP